MTTIAQNPELQGNNSRTEELSTKIQEVKKELDELKWLTTLPIQEKNAKLSEIATEIQSCSIYLEQLEADSTLSINKNELDELKSMIAALTAEKNKLEQQIKTEIESLANSVARNQNTENKEKWDESDSWKEEKWLKKWRHWLTKWQKNWIRIGWWVLAWVWLFAIFRWRRKKTTDNNTWTESPDDTWQDDREARREKRRKRREARREARRSRPFWQRPIWKVIKWWGVWFWVYKLWKRLGRRWTEGPTWRDSDKEKFDGYNKFAEKPENKEKFENYESLWDKVDNVYTEIYGRELKSWYEDELVMEKIAKEQSKWTKNYKWIVPYCLDNQFKTIEGILWQNSSFKTALNNGLDWMIRFVKDAWNNFLKMFAESYLENLPSWAPFKNAAWSLSDKVDQWKLKNENAEKEMQYFFRQSIRVQTYFFQKKDQLVKKLVKEASQTYWIPEDDLWNDKDKFEKYVEKHPKYQNFINSPIHSAVTVLTQYNIFDSSIDEDIKTRVKEIDEDRDRILWCKKWEKDIIEIINDKKEHSEQLDANDDKKLWEACTWMVNSMDNILEAAEESAWNIYWDLFRSGDANMREYLEKSWLDKMFMSYKQILAEKKDALINWQLNNEDKIALAESINGMLALKKEAELWEMTIEKDYDEYGNIVYRIPGFLSWSVKNLYKWVCKLCHGEWKEWLTYMTSGCLWTWVLITATWAVLLLSKTTRSAWKVLVKTWAVIATLPVSLPWTLIYKGLNQIKPVRDFGHKINPVRYRWEKWAENLLDDLCSGKISLDRAWKIVERRSCGFFTWGAQEKARKDMFWAAEDVKWNMKAFDAIVKKQHGVSYLKDIKDSWLYDSLLSKRDVSQEIRQAVKQWKPVEELKTMVWKTSEVVSDLRRAFGTKIDDAIKVLRASNWPLEQNAIKRLENLWSKLSDDEVEAFMKMMDNGFDVKYIGHLDQLFNLKGSVKGIPNKQLWEHLKDLLMEWKYAEFKRLVSGKQVKNGLWRFKNIVSNDSSFIKHMDTFFKRKNWIRWLGDDVVECIAKTFAKIFSKIL